MRINFLCKLSNTRSATTSILRRLNPCVNVTACAGLQTCRPKRCGASPQLFRDMRIKRTFAKAVERNGGVESTIYALSTAPGRAAIAIIRISGAACMKIYEKLCPGKPPPKPRFAAFRTLYDSSSSTHSTATILDSGTLVLFFPAPKSVTGEDVLELHVHGGPAIVKAVLSAIGRCNDREMPVRYAEAGEFTKRAFMNDRLNLTQVEALGETLSAVTEEQRRLSVQGTVSGLAERYESWRVQLLQARGELEALIDFQEDQHFEESSNLLVASVVDQVKSLIQTISFHTSNAIRGELLRNGISISLLGSPNVGKSSLLNLIVGRNAAIVSKEAGTTRDIVEVGIDIGGYFCRLGDTAGLRRAEEQQRRQEPGKDHHITIGVVEEEGIKRAKENATKSDLVIVVLSVEPSPDNQGCHVQFPEEIIETVNELLEMKKNVILVVNKMDLYGKEEEASQMIRHLALTVHALIPTIPLQDVFCISCKDADVGTFLAENPGQLRSLVDGLIRKFKTMTTPVTPDSDEIGSSMWEESLGTTARQKDLLNSCITYLAEFLEATQPPDSDFERSNEEVDVVVAAESLRRAADTLARITGRVEAVGDVEEVLGVVFEKFCVGK